METNTTPSPLLSWQAPAGVEHERSGRWYLVAGVIAVSLIAYGIATGDWVLAVVLTLTAGVYFLLRDQHGKEYHMRIFPAGIEIDGTMHTWDAWKNYWILIGPSHAELHVLRKKPTREFIVLIDALDPFVVRDTFAEFIPYDGEKKEKIFDAFIRFCKL